jgi:vacuolar-type H+-ATPase subunit I/STV1
MKREELKQIAELTDEQLDRIMAINGADVEKVKAKVTALEADLKAARETIDKTKAEFDALKSSNADAEQYKSRYEALVAENEAKAKQAEAERIASERAAGIDRRFEAVVGEKKFSHDAIRSDYRRKFEAALSEKDNEGMSDADIFHALTKDDATAFSGVTPVKLQGGRPAGTGSGYSSIKDIMNSDMTREQKRQAIAENVAKGNVE